MRKPIGIVSLLLLVSAAAFAATAVIPKPVSHQPASGSFVLTAETAIVTTAEARAAAERLAEDLRTATGHPLPDHQGRSPRNSAIHFAIDTQLGDEAYRLDIEEKQIRVQAGGPAGAFYASQTLRQLLPPEIYSTGRPSNVTWTIPCGRIEDRPRFAWRGALVDVARHFMPKQTLLKFIDALAMHKINRLQLHLTDDQGWRVEIKRYPKLTEVGSMRRETLAGHLRDKDRKFDGAPHGGFYSQEDLREIVAYAKARYIDIVPEIEMPGHAQAAIAAYPELGYRREPLEVLTLWGVSKNLFSAEEETILFLQNVLAEVIEIFPGLYIHIGGDEAPKDQWKASVEAQARIRELGLKDETELQSYFTRRMDRFLTEHGRRLVGWDEILEGGLAPGAVVMSWHGAEGGIAAARAGHDVVMAPTTHTYFDYYQSREEGEPLAIGGYLPLEKAYSFEPVPAELTATEARHILGAQGQLWTEYISTESYLEYMAFPRLSALAEVTWTPADKKDYADFLTRLATHEQRLRHAGVNFRPAKR